MHTHTTAATTWTLWEPLLDPQHQRLLFTISHSILHSTQSIQIIVKASSVRLRKFLAKFLLLLMLTIWLQRDGAIDDVSNDRERLNFLLPAWFAHYLPIHHPRHVSITNVKEGITLWPKYINIWTSDKENKNVACFSVPWRKTNLAIVKEAYCSSSNLNILHQRASADKSKLGVQKVSSH
jgi:hypothetical protein